MEIIANGPFFVGLTVVCAAEAFIILLCAINRKDFPSLFGLLPGHFVKKVLLIEELAFVQVNCARRLPVTFQRPNSWEQPAHTGLKLLLIM